MTLVVDASAVLAALVDGGDVGRWAQHQLAAGGLVAPQILPAEVTSGLRRLEATGVSTGESALLALQDLLHAPISLAPYGPMASRIWELRSNVTPYDAWYVALAEELDAPLATADHRLAGAPGPRCRFHLP